MKSFWKGLAVATVGLGLTIARGASAASLTLDVANVRTAQGKVMVSLCVEGKGQFPGGCREYGAAVAATPGRVTLHIDNIAPGRYALQAFHDANDNNTPDMPIEGFAFGNNVPYPPSISGASVKVEGDARTEVTMTYLGAPGAAQPVGLKGVEPPRGIQRMDVRNHGLYGEYYVAQGAAHAPGLVLIGGSEGGVQTISAMATSFAQEGFAVLALAYWGEQGLPETLENIPLEYFDRAVAWLQQQPQVNHGGIGMLGWSRGSEAALLTAARNPAVHAVVGVAPSGVVWQGLHIGSVRAALPAWTLGGKALPSLSPDGASYRQDAPLARLFQASFKAVDATANTQIRVENTHGGVLLISGGDDHIWPSMRFSDRIMARLQAMNFKGRYEHLHYPEAGHAVFVGSPEGPMAQALRATNSAMGGSTAANLAAWQDNWPKTLEFLRSQLKEGTR